MTKWPDEFEKKTVPWMQIIAGGLILFSILLLIYAPTFDWSDIHASVKVMEVGKRYTALNIGEQHYIRVLNAFSEQFASSSESWETCIDASQVKYFTQVKNNKTIVDIHVVGYGLGTSWRCVTGDRVV